MKPILKTTLDKFVRYHYYSFNCTMKRAKDAEIEPFGYGTLPQRGQRGVGQ